MLPEPIEQIAQKAETGAAELARNAITLGYELLNDLVGEVRAAVQTIPRNDAPPNGNTSSPPRQFLSVEEAADFLRLRPSTLYLWVSNDRIPYSKAGSRILFDRDALIEFVRTRDGREKKPSEEDSQTRLRMLK